MDAPIPSSMDVNPPPPPTDTPKMDTDSTEPPKEALESEKKAVDETPPAKLSEQEEKKPTEPEQKKPPEPEENKPLELEQKRTPEPGDKKKTTISPAIIVAILVLLSLGMLWYMSQKPLSPTTNIPIQQSSAPKTVNISVEEVAGDSSRYLDSIDGKDSMTLQTCDNKNICRNQTLAKSPQNSAWKLMWYVGLYQMTGDESYREKINGGMDDIIDQCNDTIANCPNDTTGGEHCAYIISQVSKAYGITKNPRHLAFIKDLGVCLVHHRYTPTPMLEAIDGGDMSLIYGLSKSGDSGVSDPPGFDRSSILLKGERKIRYSEVLNNQSSSYVIYREGGFEFRQPACWTQLAKLEMYESTGDGTYLNEVREFFDKAKLDEHLSKSPDGYTYIALDILPCLESLLILQRATNDSRYDATILGLDNYLGNNYLDSKAKPIARGDGGLFVFQANAGNTFNVKSISDNAHFIYLLSNQRNATISIVSAK